jgi:hypothetical protein
MRTGMWLLTLVPGFIILVRNKFMTRATLRLLNFSCACPLPIPWGLRVAHLYINNSFQQFRKVLYN